MAHLNLTTIGIGLLITPGFLTTLVLAQAGDENPAAPRAEYKIAFWYDRTQPLQTFRHQVYDVGKGEYDEATVRRWLDLMHARFPYHAAYVKDVPTRLESGQEGTEAVAAVIAQEKQRLVESRRRALSNDNPRRTDFGRLMRPSISGYTPSRSTTGRRTLIMPPSGASSFGYTPTSPFPFPYPRPHP